MALHLSSPVRPRLSQLSLSRCRHNPHIIIVAGPDVTLGRQLSEGKKKKRRESRFNILTYNYIGIYGVGNQHPQSAATICGNAYLDLSCQKENKKHGLDHRANGRQRQGSHWGPHLVDETGIRLTLSVRVLTRGVTINYKTITGIQNHDIVAQQPGNLVMSLRSLRQPCSPGAKDSG